MAQAKRPNPPPFPKREGGKAGEGSGLSDTLLCVMESYPEALEHLEYSLEHSGPDAYTFYNIGLCQDALQQNEKALESARQALAQDPTFDPAKSLIVKIESRLSRQASRATYNW